MKQNESNGDLEFITTIGVEGKLSCHLKINKKKIS